MATTFTLVPVPEWYFADLTGKPLGGGFMYTFRSLNKTQQKPIYQDQAGALPWPNPVRFNLNGQQGPFFWADDEPYYVVVTDKNGETIFDIDGYGPGAAGGGGGGPVTVNAFIQNYVVNNGFWRNIGTINPLPNGASVIAPGNHDGFFPSLLSDVAFNKDNGTATDRIDFQEFNKGTVPLAPDTTPNYYVTYTCTGAGSGEVRKGYYFPIVYQAKNLEQQQITASIWTQLISGANTVNMYVAQFFGAGGGASAPVYTTIGAPITAVNSWQQAFASTSIPSVGAATFGLNGQSGVYLYIEMPLNAATVLNIAKPSFFLGNIQPPKTFQTYDEVSAVADSPRTGDIRIGINSFTPFGWCPMNDGVITKMTPGAPPAGYTVARANIDTYPLFFTIWNLFSASQALAPMFNSAGTPVAYSNPVTDFAAGNQLALTKSAGRVLANVGTPFTPNSDGSASFGTLHSIGQYIGAQRRTLILSEIPDHAHNALPGQPFVTSAPNNNIFQTVGNGSTVAVTGNIAGYTGQTALALMQPVSFMNVFIKL